MATVDYKLQVKRLILWTQLLKCYHEVKDKYADAMDAFVCDRTIAVLELLSEEYTPILATIVRSCIHANWDIHPSTERIIYNCVEFVLKDPTNYHFAERLIAGQAKIDEYPIEEFARIERALTRYETTALKMVDAYMTSALWQAFFKKRSLGVIETFMTTKEGLCMLGLYMIDDVRRRFSVLVKIIPTCYRNRHMCRGCGNPMTRKAVFGCGNCQNAVYFCSKQCRTNSKAMPTGHSAQECLLLLSTVYYLRKR